MRGTAKPLSDADFQDKVSERRNRVRGGEKGGDTRDERLILRNKGLLLSAELHLIGTAVAYGYVERLPHPPTPLAAQPLDKKAASPGGLLAF